MTTLKAIVFLVLGILVLLPATSFAAGEAHGAAATAEHGDAHGGGHGGAGLPPKINEGIVTAFTALIIFVLLVIILGKTAWGPIASGLKAREDKIRNDIREAEEARARAEATLNEYRKQLASAEQQVRDLIAKAQKDGEQIATNIKMKAQQDAEEIKEKANKDIDLAKNTAIREVYETTANLSTSIAEKILKRNINPQDQQDLVNAGIEQFQMAAAKN